MKKLPTVTLAVCAYNEEKNIVPFLESVLKQKEDGFSFQNIWIHSDGSKDKTVDLARKYKSKKIIIWDHKERKGKSTWLNKIYSDLKSDILVQTDADVVFAHPLVIKNLIAPIVKDKKVGMCGGNPQPKAGMTYTEKAINRTFEVYSKFRLEVRGGSNVFSADGRLLAYRKELVKKITVPANMIANDVYTYYCCLSLGYLYIYAKSAVVLFRSPQNVSEHIHQNTRFLSVQYRMKRYFDESLVTSESYIPRGILIKHLVLQFFKSPIMSTYIMVLNQYCRVRAKINERRLNAKWFIATSTKKLTI